MPGLPSLPQIKMVLLAMLRQGSIAAIVAATITATTLNTTTIELGSAATDRPVILEQSGTADTCIARALLDISGYSFIKFSGKKGTGTNVNAVFRMRVG